jgi:hypothetical protein
VKAIPHIGVRPIWDWDESRTAPLNSNCKVQIEK